MFRQAPSFPYHDLGIVEDGNTASRAISKDAYVIWKGESYFASTDILQGATLEEDVNLTAIPDGVINGVVSALNNNFTLVGTRTGTTAISIPANAKELFIEVTLNNNTSALVTFFIPTSTIVGERSYRAGYSFTGTYMGTAIIIVNASTVKLDEAYLNNNMNVTSTSVIKLYAK